MSAKRLSAAVAATLLTVAAAGAVRAEPPTGGGYYAYADVVNVTPRYGWHEVSEPVLQCVEPARHRALRAPGGRDYGYTDYDYTGYGYAEYGYAEYGSTDYRGHGRHHPARGDGAAGLVGGLIGGLIGHQFGGGNGKTALTIAGAAIGASVARGYARERREVDPYRADWPERYEPVRHCTERYQTRRVRGVSGYDVTYRYQGATFHKWVDEHPGDVIRVHVDVAPIAGG